MSAENEDKNEDENEDENFEDCLQFDCHDQQHYRFSDVSTFQKFGLSQILEHYIDNGVLVLCYERSMDEEKKEVEKENKKRKRD